MTGKTCFECVFFAESRYVPAGGGLCHRWAPIAEPGTMSLDLHVLRFPPVLSSDWCGEHRTAAEIEAAAAASAPRFPLRVNGSLRWPAGEAHRGDGQ